MSEQLSLSWDEKTRLDALEAVIDEGLKTFVEVGNALLEIRDSRLYRGDFGTFEDYCRERWQMERAHAYRLIDAAQVIRNLSPMGDIPTSERQVRPLTKLEPSEQRLAWKLATAVNPNPTASDVEEVAQTITRAVNDAIRDSANYNNIEPKQKERIQALDEMWIQFIGGLSRLTDLCPEFDAMRVARGDDEATAALHVQRAQAVIGMLSSFIKAMHQTYPHVLI
jgi:hypothetical protein